MLAEKLLGLIDLTSLNENDTEADIKALCDSAITEFGPVAAICIYPRFIPYAKALLSQVTNNPIKIATVVNFPHGNDTSEEVARDTKAAIVDGADEIDLVIPYQQLIAGNEQAVKDIVSSCRHAIDGAGKQRVILKVIIESGTLGTEAMISRASQLAINSGADMIKTSTGKVDVNATPEAAEAMLEVIKNNPSIPVGFKAAGGIRTYEDAQSYVAIASEKLGDEWVNSSNFRFGASGLLNSLLARLSGEKVTTQGSY